MEPFRHSKSGAQSVAAGALWLQRVLQDPFGSENGTFLAGRVISISGLFF